MDHYTPRKYRGPETWALVRDAYLSGEPARLVCQRFDVSYANLRAKASREGWTRSAFAGATDLSGARRSPPPQHRAPPEPPPPVTTETALDAAMNRASNALIEGHAGEANAILKAAETFARLNGRDVTAPMPIAPHDPKQAEQALLGFMEDIWAQAEVIAKTMMSDDRAHLHPVWASRNIYAWRAEHFGPEVVAADYAYARGKTGMHEKIWDENGVIYPPTPPDQIPPHMQGMFEHYGPNKKRKAAPGAVDEF